MNKSRRILISNNRKIRDFCNELLANCYIKFCRYNIKIKNSLKLTMYQIIKKSWDKTKYPLLPGLALMLLLLVTVVYKSDEKITKKSALIKNSTKVADLKTFK